MRGYKPSLDLARGSPRQVCGDVELLGTLEGRQLAATVLEHIGLGGLLAGPQHNSRLHFLAVLVVGDPKSDRLCHSVVRQEHCINLTTTITTIATGIQVL